MSKLSFFDLKTIHDKEERASSISINAYPGDNAKICGALYHGDIILPTKENIKTFRSLANYLEKQAKKASNDATV